MKKILILSAMAMSLAALAEAAEPAPVECQVQAEKTVKAILQLQGRRVDVIQTKQVQKEEDEENTYYTFFIAGFRRTKTGELEQQTVDSRVTFVPSSAPYPCVMTDYALPGAS